MSRHSLEDLLEYLDKNNPRIPNGKPRVWGLFYLSAEIGQWRYLQVYGHSDVRVLIANVGLDTIDIARIAKIRYPDHARENPERTVSYGS